MYLASCSRKWKWNNPAKVCFVHTFATPTVAPRNVAFASTTEVNTLAKGFETCLTKTLVSFIASVDIALQCRDKMAVAR
jgi:hypothetical protein